MVAKDFSAGIGEMTSPPWPGCKVLIIEARFYEDISDALFDGASAELSRCGVDFSRATVPGAMEIPQVLASATSAKLIPRAADNALYCGAIVLGCVIRGETPHFDIVCENANTWTMKLAIENSIPVGNGILTVENKQQALERARGERHGKGAAAARACLRLIELQREFQGISA